MLGRLVSSPSPLAEMARESLRRIGADRTG